MYNYPGPIPLLSTVWPIPFAFQLLEVGKKWFNILPYNLLRSSGVSLAIVCTTIEFSPPWPEDLIALWENDIWTNGSCSFNSYYYVLGKWGLLSIYIISVIISSLKATFNIFSSCDYFIPRWAIRGDTAWYGLQRSKVRRREARWLYIIPRALHCNQSRKTRVWSNDGRRSGSQLGAP